MPREIVGGYIGTTAYMLELTTTFHSFAISLIEKYYHLLDFTHIPKLLDDATAALADEILEKGWNIFAHVMIVVNIFMILRHLFHFSERITPEQFSALIDNEVKQLETDPENIIVRVVLPREKLKSDTLKKIEGLNRTKEVMEFYGQYEQLKRDRDLLWITTMYSNT